MQKNSITPGQLPEAQWKRGEERNFNRARNSSAISSLTNN